MVVCTLKTQSVHVRLTVWFIAQFCLISLHMYTTKQSPRKRVHHLLCNIIVYTCRHRHLLCTHIMFSVSSLSWIYVHGLWLDLWISRYVIFTTYNMDTRMTHVHILSNFYSRLHTSNTKGCLLTYHCTIHLIKSLWLRGEYYQMIPYRIGWVYTILIEVWRGLPWFSSQTLMHKS